LSDWSKPRALFLVLFREKHETGRYRKYYGKAQRQDKPTAFFSRTGNASKKARWNRYENNCCNNRKPVPRPSNGSTPWAMEFPGIPPVGNSVAAVLARKIHQDPHKLVKR
jgi:hypothetical protein